jgi:hypothetical protein
VNINSSKVTKPTARPAPARAAPKRVKWPLVRCVTTAALARSTPAINITALSTDRTVASRTLSAVAVSERTAQRSHRGMRLASHTGRSAD